jgi:hypothetical protein
MAVFCYVDGNAAGGLSRTFMADRTGTAFYAAWTLAAYSSQIVRIVGAVFVSPREGRPYIANSVLSTL